MGLLVCGVPPFTIVRCDEMDYLRTPSFCTSDVTALDREGILMIPPGHGCQMTLTSSATLEEGASRGGTMPLATLLKKMAWNVKWVVP